MASKQTYECFACRKNGFDNVRVYLDGKTDAGKTIYKNEDMTEHIHKAKQKQVPVSQTQWGILCEKLDHILAILEKQG